MDWKALVAEHVQHAPFMLVTHNGIDHRKFDLVRILEGLLVAAATAFATMYAVQYRMEAQIKAMGEQMTAQWSEVNRKLDKVEGSIRDERFERITDDKDILRRMDSMHPMNHDWRTRK